MQGRGFGYVCSNDGLAWQRGSVVAVPGGTRTPYGLLPLTTAELVRRRADVLRYNVIDAAGYDKPNTSLQWSFYTVEVGGWEEFRASIVQLTW